jgi:putative Mg2+ transporter-C (MgtC) family protein
VSGIGFLGAGAILKYGTSVRGLTTAASLWATAGVGMAAGAGAWVVAALAAVLIVFSLGPLNWLATRFQIGQEDLFRLRVAAEKPDALAAISKALAARKVEIASVRTQRVDTSRVEMELDLRLRAGTKQEDIIAALTTVADLEILESGAPTE